MEFIIQQSLAHKQQNKLYDTNMTKKVICVKDEHYIIIK